MNCNQAIDKLELFVLDGLDAEEREGVAAHLLECAACRGQVDALQGTMGAISACVGLAGETVDLREFHKRAYAEIDAARVCFRWHVVLAKAAAVALFCGGVFLGVKHYRGAGNPEVCECEPWMRAGISSGKEWGSVFPLVRDGRVFAMRETPGGLHVAAFDKRSGKPLWEAPYAVRSIPDSDGQHLVAWATSSDNKNTLVSICPDTGKASWTLKVDGTILSRPMLLKDGVCWTDGKRINLVDASSGAVLWSSGIEKSEGLSLPATDGKNIYVASAQTLYAFDGKTGRLIWEHLYESGTPTWSKRTAMISTDGGKVLVARTETTQKGMLYCHDAGVGAVAWSKPIAAPVSLLAASGKVFVRSGMVEAFALSNGNLLWSVKEAGCSPLTMADNTIYVVAGQDKRQIATFNADTGEPLKQFELPGSCTGIVVQGKRGFLNSRAGILYSVKLNNSAI